MPVGALAVPPMAASTSWRGRLTVQPCAGTVSLCCCCCCCWWCWWSSRSAMSIWQSLIGCGPSSRRPLFRSLARRVPRRAGTKHACRHQRSDTRTARGVGGRPPRELVRSGDQRVSITDTPGGSSLGWSFAPDNVIVVSARPTTPDVVVEEFVRALEPVSGSELGEACAWGTHVRCNIDANAAAIGPSRLSLAARTVSNDRNGMLQRTRLTRRADRSSDRCSDRNGRPRPRRPRACRGDLVDDCPSDAIERHHGVAESGVHYGAGHPPDHARLLVLGDHVATSVA